MDVWRLRLVFSVVALSVLGICFGDDCHARAAEAYGVSTYFPNGSQVLPAPRQSLPSHIERLPPVESMPMDVHRSPPGQLRRLPPVESCTESGSAFGPVDSRDWLRARVQRHAIAAGRVSAPFCAPPLPVGYVPWWQQVTLEPLRRGARPHSVRLEDLLIQALKYSPHVQAIRDTALSRSTAIVEAEAEFDILAFMDSKFVRTSDPIGSLLTTGRLGRYRDNDWSYNSGFSKRTRYGGTTELKQQYGFQDNNSEFLVPKAQGKARLSLRFDQPLLNGAGRLYNRSHIVLAQLDTRIAQDEVARDLTQQLFEVTQAYWDLYLRRAALRQKQRNVDRAQKILGRLEDRSRIDALQSQILTARAAVAMRQADLSRAAAAIRNAETRLRSLVNAPDLFQGVPLELIPASAPSSDRIRVALGDALVTALYHRPEVDKAIHETRMAAVRLDMSASELKPVLNLVLETYVAGLEGNAQIDQAWVDQFTVGEPGYTAGFLFEVPLENRAAKARFQRRQIELRQVTSQLRSTVDLLTADVEIAVREVETSFGEILSWYRSMVATRAEVRYLEDRWQLLPGDDRAASFLLEDLLKAQDRLAVSEFGFVQSQYTHTLALVRLKQAMGTLLDCDTVSDISSSLPASGRP